MAEQYNIQELMADVFGLRPRYVIPGERQASPQLSFAGIETLPEYYDSNMTTWMGTPVLFPVKFHQGGYNRYTLSGRLETVNMPDYYLPATTMISFRRGKIMERTNLLGNNGTVKEIYSFDDWVMDVKGLCLNDPESSAIEKLNALLAWEKLADSIRVSGQLFTPLDIHAVSIADWQHDPIQAGDGNLSFRFIMYGDEPKD